MLRLMRAGARPGRPSLVVRTIAALIVLGMVVAAVPLIGRLLVWLTGLLQRGPRDCVPVPRPSDDTGWGQISSRQLLGSGLIARSGAHARSLVTDRLAGGDQAQLQITDESSIRQVVDRFGLLPSASGNLTIRVADVPGLTRVGVGDGDAHRLVVSADLLESSDARSRLAGEALLSHVLSGVRSTVTT